MVTDVLSFVDESVRIASRMVDSIRPVGIGCWLYQLVWMSDWYYFCLASKINR